MASQQSTRLKPSPTRNEPDWLVAARKALGLDHDQADRRIGSFARGKAPPRLAPVQISKPGVG